MKREAARPGARRPGKLSIVDQDKIFPQRLQEALRIGVPGCGTRSTDARRTAPNCNFYIGRTVVGCKYQSDAGVAGMKAIVDIRLGPLGRLQRNKPWHVSEYDVMDSFEDGGLTDTVRRMDGIDSIGLL